MAWMIEKGSSPVSRPLYWSGGLPIWSENHIDGIRMERREDAEKVANGTLNGHIVRICEHIWME